MPNNFVISPLMQIFDQPNLDCILQHQLIVSKLTTSSMIRFSDKHAHSKYQLKQTYQQVQNNYKIVINTSVYSL